MSETVGKLIECDRCGKTHFVPSEPVKIAEYRDVFKVGKYGEMPEGWTRHLEIGLLCDDCEKKYQELMDEFFGK